MGEQGEPSIDPSPYEDFGGFIGGAQRASEPYSWIYDHPLKSTVHCRLPGPKPKPYRAFQESFSRAFSKVSHAGWYCLRFSSTVHVCGGKVGIAEQYQLNKARALHCKRYRYPFAKFTALSKLGPVVHAGTRIKWESRSPSENCLVLHLNSPRTDCNTAYHYSCKKQPLILAGIEEWYGTQEAFTEYVA